MSHHPTHAGAEADTKVQTPAHRLFAPFWQRMAAILVDAIMLLFLVDGLQDHVLSPLGMATTDHRPLVLVLMLGYFAVSWISPMRSTVGQFLVGIRVVDVNCETLKPGPAMVRCIALVTLFVGACVPMVVPDSYLALTALCTCAGLLLAAVTPNRQGAHDFLARSMVVNRTALESREQTQDLRNHVTATAGGRRRPAYFSMLANALLLGAPIFVMFNVSLMMKTRNMMYRTGYALAEVRDLKIAMEDYYARNARLPRPGEPLRVETSGRYPDGGHYALEEDGAIRIRFEVKPELKYGTITVRPTHDKQQIIWKCSSDGNIRQRYLPAECRDRA